ncbi:MAG: ribbon-helix-helix domain-containing protein [Actinomycetota bacterium]|jgi:RHH-type rel operon transcriptional repressor/antitoxin RelB|nr:ribbon-helix-helix domain-containing protein [Actinomycetota bacterium]
MSKVITVRIPEEVSERLDDLSREIKREKSFIIKSALEQYLDEYADYQIAFDRLKNKDDKIITSEDLRKELGI